MKPFYICVNSLLEMALVSWIKMGIKKGLEIPWLEGVKPRVKEVFYLGSWREEVFTKCVAVVGSRRMTQYGERVVEKLVPGLVDQGYTIVSGFMYGVDQAAHRMTVACGGRTVAVLGWGISYPMSNDECLMSNKIVDSGGLIISEWEKQEPMLWTFPLRNRIVAAMGSDIYVVEAASFSGALITVGWGRKLGKKIWAVPGPVTSKVSEGTNKLIADGLAKMWVPNENKRAGEFKSISGGTNIGDLYTVLQNDALTIDELVRKTRKSAQEVGAALTMMTLRGEVSEREGKYYINDQLT